MEQNHKYSIKEVSELLQIPKATIRYWESMELITLKREQQNEYRQFSVSNIMELSNVSFYRGLNIPIKELKDLFTSDISSQGKFLNEAEDKIENQLKELFIKKKRIQMQKVLLNEVYRLQNINIHQGRPYFSHIVEFNEKEKEHWRITVEEPYSFTLVFMGDNNYDYRFGIGYTDEEIKKAPDNMKFIWQKHDHKYLEDLLIVDFYDESSNNLSHIYDNIRNMGYEPKGAVAQYLASGQKSEFMDYYKVWIKI